MTLAAVVGGILLIAVALRDVLHELFHPAGSGAIARQLMRGLWGGFRNVAGRWPSFLPLAGPTIIVVTIAVWALLVGLGWALIYWPFLPDDFRFASPLVPAEQGGFGTALYVSFVALATLGLGDISPTVTWLRAAVVVEALVGLALVTAGISWILQLYPVLTRRRAFASRARALARATAESGVLLIDREAPELARLLDDLTRELTVLRADLGQSPISYYFHDDFPPWALAPALQIVLEAAEGAEALDSPSVRHAATALRTALGDFASLIAHEHLPMHQASPREVFAALARDHLRREVGAGNR